MLVELQHWQQTVGPVAAASIPFVVGFVVGAGLTALTRRRVKAAPAWSLPSQPMRPPSELSVPIATAGSEKKDGRRTPRRSGRAIEAVLAYPGNTDLPHQALVINRSVGGLCVMMGAAVPEGTLVLVLPATASKMTPWVEAVVKSCRRHDDEWEIGLQFVKIPPYSTMVLFG